MANNNKTYELTLYDPETRCIIKMPITEENLELEYMPHITMLYQELKKLIKRFKGGQQPCE